MPDDTTASDANHLPEPGNVVGHGGDATPGAKRMNKVSDDTIRGAILGAAVTGCAPDEVSWGLAKTHCKTAGQAGQLDRRVREMLMSMIVDEHVLRMASNRRVYLTTSPDEPNLIDVLRELVAALQESSADRGLIASHGDALDRGLAVLAAIERGDGK